MYSLQENINSLQIIYLCLIMYLNLKLGGAYFKISYILAKLIKLRKQVPMLLPDSQDHGGVY